VKASIQALAAILVFFSALPVAGGEISGPPKVIDGDTVEVAGERIRLHGIDAPEMRQDCTGPQGLPYSCGKKSKAHLSQIIGLHELICQATKRDRYGRLIATCTTVPIQINARLVRDGWALAYRKYSPDYQELEQQAQQEGLGLWQGSFTPPWTWRLQQRRGSHE